MTLSATRTSNAAETPVAVPDEQRALNPDKPVLLLLAICAVLYFVGLGSFPIIDPSEGYYAEACREMLELGDYITPHLSYQIYFSKPILNFWLIAFSYKLFGISEFAARLPFAILSTGLVLATYWCGKQVFSRRVGFLSGFVLATSPLLLLVSRKSSIDIAFSTFVDVAVLASAVVLAKKRPWAWTAIYIALALGLLTKGPAALVLYVAGMMAFLVVARPPLRTFFDWFKTLKLIQGICLFLAVALPWHIAVSMATNGLFLKVFFLYENLARFQGQTNLGHSKIWYYFAVMAYSFAPWVVLLPAALGLGLIGSLTVGKSANVGNGIVQRVLGIMSSIREKCKNDNQARTTIMFAVWSMTIFAFFSKSGTQLATYILPIYAPVSILVAVLIDRWLQKGLVNLDKWERIWMKAFSWIFAAIGVVGAIGAVTLAVIAKDFDWLVRGAALALAPVFAFGSIKQLMELNAQRMGNSLKWTCGTTFAVMALVTPVAFYGAVNYTQGDLKEIALHAGASGDKLAMYGNFMPSSMYYADKAVNTFFHGSQMIPQVVRAEVPQGVYPNVPQSIIVGEKEFPKLQSTSPCKFELVEKKGIWSWYRTPGYEVEPTKTLEEMFANEKSFQLIMSGKSPTGPLAVPYATGKLYAPVAQRKAEAARQQ